MSETLLQKEVKVRRITTLSHQAAQGLGDPARLRILEVLAHKPMTAEEIAKALAGAGMKKATTTVRHHLDTLKRTGLIETAKMVEVRGAVMKYYSATVKAYSCSAPADLDAKAAKTINDASVRIAKVLNSVYSDKRFTALAEKEGKCKEFLAAEIINAALAKALATTRP
jgi:DNA-binding transcriptional ArsR family regulator